VSTNAGEQSGGVDDDTENWKMGSHDDGSP
jgi:hypothetical protein